MKTILAMGIVATLVCGCATPMPVQVPVIVKVPVVTKPIVPSALQACGHEAPGFKFGQLPGDDAVIAKKDQSAFQNWIEKKSDCIQAWEAWAK